MRSLGERRLAAAAVALACIAGLGALAYQAHDVRLGFTLIEGLPDDAAARQAADDAAAGFAPGIVAPTEVLVEGQGIATNPDDLTVLQGLIEQQPGVAGTIGPREQLAADRVEEAGQLPEAFVAPDGSTARILVLLDADPFSAEAIDRLGDLRGVMPALQQAAGLGQAHVSLAGQTGLADETVQESLDNVVVLSAAALLVNLFFLILFLRALIAPLYLLFASVLALGATYGITWMIVQAMGWGEITYYIPFAAAVLLLSLGSDYTIFVVGRIWEAARTRPVEEAVIDAAPRASGSITVAGLVMALSFAVLGIVAIVPLRELAIMMTVGVLIDAFVVRSILAPALVTTFGSFGGWPGHELVHDEETAPAPEATPAPAERIALRPGA
jgi:RND superfamily putative drug exporter